MESFDFKTNSEALISMLKQTVFFHLRIRKMGKQSNGGKCANESWKNHQTMFGA